jgi:hypothetical protein
MDIKALFQKNTSLAVSTPLMAAWQVAGALFALTFAGCFIAVSFLGVRPDFESKFSDLLFLAEYGSIFLASAFSALAVLMLRRPDLRFETTALNIGRTAIALMAIYAIYAAFNATTEGLSHELFSPHGNYCGIRIALISLIPSFFILRHLKRCAPTHPAHVGAFAIFSIASLASLSARIFCNVDTPAHLLIWTFSPVLLLSLIGAFVGHKLLKW